MMRLKGIVTGFLIGMVSASISLVAWLYISGRASDSAYWSVASSMLTAVATIILVLVTALLWIVTDRTASASERAAEAANEAVRLSETTAKQQLRAYVVVTDARVVHFVESGVQPFIAAGSPTLAEVYFINKGQTPAKNVRVNLDARILPVPEREEDMQLNDMPPASSLTAGPNDPKTSHAVIRTPLSIAEYQSILAGTSAIFIVGYLEYEDIFGEIHRSSFRFRNLSGVNDGSTSFCSRGNIME